MEDLTKILRIDSSARRSESVSRQLVDSVVDRLTHTNTVQITSRDVSNGLPFIDEEWVVANFTPIEARTPSQKQKLGLSDDLVAEVKDADIIVLGIPIYNFGVPASLKAWIDLIARAGVTFNYTESGPVGLLQGKRVIIALASGGTVSGSEIDFATPHLIQVLKFVGITDVTVIAADALGQSGSEKVAEAHKLIAQI